MLPFKMETLDDSQKKAKQSMMYIILLLTHYLESPWELILNCSKNEAMN